MKHTIKKLFSLPKFAGRFSKQPSRFLIALVLLLVLPAFSLFTTQSALAQTATPTPIMLTISGNAGAPWATLINTDTIDPVIADINGNYSFSVPSGWTRDVFVGHKDYTFSPDYISYNNVTTNQTGKNYTATLRGSVTGGVYHSCWVKSNGTVACWGSNVYGETVPASGTFRQLSAGYRFTCGIKTNNTIACWGSNSLGESTPPSGTFVQISSASSHSCGVKGDGSIVCWGSNTFGESTPPSGTFKQVSAGTYNGCGLKDDNTITCWGYNIDGVTTAPSGTFIQVSSGDRNACALKNDDVRQSSGTIVCWGAGKTNTGVFPEYGQSIPPSGNYGDLSLGANFGCASDEYGHEVCWGLSVTDTTPEGSVVFRQISSGGAHTCGMQIDNTLTCWGNNSNGQAQPITIQGKAVPGTTLSYTDGVAQTVNTDSNGNFSIAVSYNWSGTLTPSKSGTTFTPASKSYTNLISNPASQTFSVVTTFTSNGTDDGWVLESTQTSEVGGSMDSTSNAFAVGDDAANRQYRGIVSFDTSSLPNNAVIQSVTLRVRQYVQVGDNNPLNGSNLRIDIAQGPFSTYYALQLADFEATPSGDTIAIIPINSTPDANGWYSALFNATGKSLINLINKTQLRLRFGLADNNDDTADFLKFYSGNYADTSSNPELIITYTLP